MLKFKKDQKSVEKTRKGKISILAIVIASIILGSICCILIIKCFTVSPPNETEVQTAIDELTAEYVENGETDNPDTSSQKTSYSAEGFNFTVTADDSWTRRPSMNNYNLELYNADEDIYFSISANKKTDLIEGITFLDFEKEFINTMKDLLGLDKEIQPLEVILSTDDMKICSSMYEAEKYNEKGCIYNFCVDLTDSEEMLMVVVTGPSSALLHNKEMIEEMVTDIK